MTESKVVLITGASSGIGYECAELFLKDGHTLYCASRSAKGPGGHLLHMDVTDEKSVHQGVERIIGEQGHIDIMLHCAGNGFFGPLETLTKEDMCDQLDVNLFAAVTLTNAVLPHMRERNAGLLMYVSSVASSFAIPYQVPYSCSKSALSMFVKGLRLELKQLNVNATLIEPGDVKTGFTLNRKRFKSACPEHYKESMKKAVSRMEHDEQNGMSAKSAAHAVYKLAQRKSPPASKTIGWSYKLFMLLQRLLPYSFVEWALYRMYVG